MEQSNNIFTPTLLTWFAQNARDLPWRHTQDPYAIWLSEIILQQTRIAQGTAYWQRFMQRWPTVNDLARASEDEVLRFRLLFACAELASCRPTNCPTRHIPQ